MKLFGKIASNFGTGVMDVDKNPPPMPGTPRTGIFRRDTTLDKLDVGESGVVKNISGTSINRLRLMEMGLTPGVHVTVLRVAAFGGPIEISVRGYRLSLRRSEASEIYLGGS